MPHVTIRQLEVFSAAAQTLSFARVAEKLHLTPAAISFQIRQIEQQTGFALFERIGRGIALTQAGLILLDYARPVLQSMRDLDQAMLALQGAGGGRIRLGLVSTAKYIVPHIVARFRARFPGVTVQMREGNKTEIHGWLAAGDIDLAIMGQPSEEADLAAARFAANPSVIVAPPNHPLCGQTGITPEKLRTQFFIVREPGSGTRSLSDGFFTTAGFAPRIAMETSSNEMIKQAVMAGMGLAVLSQHTVGLEQSLGLLTVLPVAGFPILRAWFIVQRRTSPLLPDQSALRHFLIDKGQTIIDELGLGQRHAAQQSESAMRLEVREGVEPPYVDLQSTT